MIKIQTLDLIENVEYVVRSTIFPDGTSQVWHLPEEIINSLNVKVTWNFEAERELIDILSLSKILHLEANRHLHIPYLPYARQDKGISNNSTFNLTVFGEILNLAKFDLVTAVDVHNNLESILIIKQLNIIPVYDKINKLAENYAVVVFPDSGAQNRYSSKISNSKQFFCIKERDQGTGTIMMHYCDSLDARFVETALIVDDICDGGATFISVAKMLKRKNPNILIDLYVTHGIFSKGKQILHDAGIQNIYTTNSLLKNTDGFKV